MSYAHRFQHTTIEQENLSIKQYIVKYIQKHLVKQLATANQENIFLILRTIIYAGPQGTVHSVLLAIQDSSDRDLLGNSTSGQ